MVEEQDPPGGAAATVRANGSVCWARIEPSIDALLADPIATLLMRADGLTVRDVENALRAARKRRAHPRAHSR
jgi:hypothetical protein